MPRHPRKTTVALKKMLDEIGYKDGANSKDVRSLRRINSVKAAYLDFLNGARYTEVLNKLENGDYGEKGYAHKEAQLVLREAKELIRIDFDMERPFLKEQLYSYLTDIYNKCKDKGDYYNSIQAINSIMKLVGLTDQKQQQIKIESEGAPVTIRFGFDENDEEQNKATDTEYEEIDNNNAT